MRRGEIFWCNLEPVKGHEQGALRAVVVVSADVYNESRSPLVGVVPLTKSLSKNPLHVELLAEETGLASSSTALIDHARFIHRSRLQAQPVGRVKAASLLRMDKNLGRVFGLVPTS